MTKNVIYELEPGLNIGDVVKVIQEAGTPLDSCLTDYVGIYFSIFIFNQSLWMM